MSPLGSDGKTSVAVITGDHAFDVPNFHALFRAMPSVHAYIQPMQDFVDDAGRVAADYDVVLFYNFHQTTPAEGSRELAALQGIVERGQGLLVLHHAVLAYLKWPWWADVVGVQERGFGFDHGQTLDVDVLDRDHAITAGLEPWTMIDETYSMDSCGDDSHALLATDHELSMKTLAWTRQVGDSRVFCLQSGHDNDTWKEPAFRRVVEQGIAWCAAS
ncbi:ThuA domain-containing protein [Candidatus Poribacteria bacterium]|nr:ThuA domain-containing protein [Candidatus Poribacteria bacterium]MBT5536195.1 ThuA domain-containing protein [Candidatus Poribacteria bacterium]MBT7098550.1 ThuA domain-containing protein [Candidatus Poribacteria bacterium]MBT7807105.1 ThuA domain-containing protein [Candidatus Poribacteria bacterium]